jgi:L-alanine-DL-glutamate epimerase-like enolase superfamily enzyme
LRLRFEPRRFSSGHRFAQELGVTRFEEPVSSDDLKGLAELREARPLDLTAGAYGYDLGHFENMLPARPVNVLQAG